MSPVALPDRANGDRAVSDLAASQVATAARHATPRPGAIIGKAQPSFYCTHTLLQALMFLHTAQVMSMLYMLHMGVKCSVWQGQKQGELYGRGGGCAGGPVAALLRHCHAHRMSPERQGWAAHLTIFSF